MCMQYHALTPLPPTHTHTRTGVYPFFTFTDKSIGETIDTSVDMQLGSLSGTDLLLHADDFDNLEFHSASDDEDFVVVDCKAPTQWSFSDPGSTVNSTTRVVPETIGLYVMSWFADCPSPHTKKVSPHTNGKGQDKHKERYQRWWW